MSTHTSATQSSVQTEKKNLAHRVVSLSHLTGSVSLAWLSLFEFLYLQIPSRLLFVQRSVQREQLFIERIEAEV
jgi:hypothetical protein